MAKSRERGTGSVYLRDDPKNPGQKLQTYWISYYVGGKRKRESAGTRKKSEAQAPSTWFPTFLSPASSSHFPRRTGGLLDGHCGEFAVVLGTHRLPPNDDAPRRRSHYFTFRLRLTALQV